MLEVAAAAGEGSLQVVVPMQAEGGIRERNQEQAPCLDAGRVTVKVYWRLHQLNRGARGRWEVDPVEEVVVRRVMSLDDTVRRSE